MDWDWFVTYGDLWWPMVTSSVKTGFAKIGKGHGWDVWFSWNAMDEVTIPTACFKTSYLDLLFWIPISSCLFVLVIRIYECVWYLDHIFLLNDIDYIDYILYMFHRWHLSSVRANLQESNPIKGIPSCGPPHLSAVRRDTERPRIAGRPTSRPWTRSAEWSHDTSGGWPKSTARRGTIK